VIPVRGAFFSFAVAVLVFAPMLVEARRAAANERAQRQRGGVQPAADVPIYRWMQVAYPGAFAAMIAEGLLRGPVSVGWATAGLVIFAVSKAVKWWAIAALGPFWTFRVVVVPGAALVARGPYRFLHHPNYVAVVGELIGTALMTGAAVCGVPAVVLFGMLLKRRIAVEEEALASSARHRPCSL
jgi:methyltransferase